MVEYTAVRSLLGVQGGRVSFIGEMDGTVGCGIPVIERASIFLYIFA